MSSPITSPQPISIHIPPSLRHLAVPLSQFLSANPRYTSLVIGACIFAPQHQHQPTTLPQSGDGRDGLTSAPRLLLVQRAATERAFPNLWEVPGGSSEATDPTVLHSVAREVFEETGLHLTRVVRQVGQGVEFTSSSNIVDQNGVPRPRKVFLKLTFEIEVAELEPSGWNHFTTSRHHEGESNLNETPSESTSINATLAEPAACASPSSPSFSPPAVIINLDPAEHQRYAWVTEESFNKQDPLNTYQTVSEHQRETILQAFALRCQS